MKKLVPWIFRNMAKFFILRSGFTKKNPPLPLIVKLELYVVFYILFFDERFGVVVRILATTQEVAGSIPAQCKHLCA
jgi:hypothetical protein